MSKSNNSGGLAALTFLVFLVLKLTNVIDWSWWWVTLPLWGGIALFGVITLVTLIWVAIFKKH